MIDEKQLIEDLKRLFSNYELDLPYQDSLEILNRTIEALEQPKTDWIPCEERLPDKTMLCLCTVERGVTPYHGLNPIIDWWIVKENEQVSLFEAKKGHWKNQCNKVIAWQPLPQPYKKEGAE